ncbi:hypothetical protein H6G96_01490 [Nostoc sp. FACHB-892]|uniref:hypothetical protein n=1 Tax=Nostoc sp. FACHB-892 TaxID=2692843 RepID=UPI0016868185|nr:hypothetical protein [Nostoc sp. FACHB-892]MBD2725029.1 hypothetical protein [Nostoc sp. FACHB-892]
MNGQQLTVAIEYFFSWKSFISRYWCDRVSRPMEAISTTGYAYAKNSGNNTDGLVKSGIAVFADSLGSFF